MKSLFVLMLILFVTGCASNDYRYGVGEQGAIDAPRSPGMDQQIIVGPPHGFLDSSGWIWPGSLLAKLILWNTQVDSHRISEETIQSVKTYVEDNDLDNVQVLINTYSLGNQWGRLFRNKTVGAGWRYTLGILSVSMYTILPGRFFGGDHYNPYTNTINLYSNDVAIALHEAAHAKDSNEKKYKGTYAFTYAFPIVPLYFEAKASSDALSYMQDKGMLEDKKEAYKTLHPAYGTYVGGVANYKYWWASIPGAMLGHLTGNIAAAFSSTDPQEGGQEQESQSIASSESINTDTVETADDKVNEIEAPETSDASEISEAPSDQ